MNEIKPFDAKAAINRIRFTHPTPKDQNLDALAEIWAKALEGVTRTELDAGVGKFFQEGGRFFPKPAEIRKLALASRTETGVKIPDTLYNSYIRWEGNHEGPCPVCGAELEGLSGKARGIAGVTWGDKAQKVIPTIDEEPPAEVRVGVRHDAQKHYAAKIPWVGHSNERTAPTAGLGERPDHRLTDSLR